MKKRWRRYRDGNVCEGEIPDGFQEWCNEENKEAVRYTVDMIHTYFLDSFTDKAPRGVTKSVSLARINSSVHLAVEIERR